ncbi:MAG: ABC transporter permease [Candidatus Heimdallarchaeaceae archaeon]
MLSFSIRFFFHNKKRTFQAVLILTLALVIYIATTLLVRGYSANIGGMASVLTPSNQLLIIESGKSLSESRIENEVVHFLEDYVETTPNIEVILAQKYIPIRILGENGKLKETHLRLVNLTFFELYEKHKYLYELTTLNASEIIIGQYLSSLLSTDRGSEIQIFFPGYNTNTSAQVSNIINSKKEYDIEILANLNSFPEFNRDYYSFIELRIKDTSEIELIRNEIKKKFPFLDILEEKQTQQFILYATEDVIRTLTLLQSLFFILMLVSITYSIYTLVRESEKEIFILRSIGSTNIDIMLLFMMQALYIGTLSAILALAGGYLFICAIVAVVSATADLPFIALTLYPNLVGLIFIFAISLSVISGIYPSMVAAKIRVIKEER